MLSVRSRLLPGVASAARRTAATTASNPHVDVVDKSFNQLLQTPRPIVLDAHASWCGPCHQLDPILKKAAEAVPNVLLAKVDVDENEIISSQLKIQSLPSVFGISNGTVVSQFVGMKSYDDVLQFFKDLDAKHAEQADAQGDPTKLEVDKATEVATKALEEIAKPGLEPENVETLKTLFGAVLLNYELLPQETEHATKAQLRMKELARDEIRAKALVGLYKVAKAQSDVAAETSYGEHLQMYADSKIATAANAALEARMTTLSTKNESPPSAPSDADADAVALENESDLDASRRLFAAGNQEDALKRALNALRQDPSDEDAKSNLTDFFKVLGASHPLVNTYRRKMTSILL